MKGRQIAAQFFNLLETLASLPVYIMGDFNNVAQIRGEGYDYVRAHSWTDLYEAAETKDDGATVVKAIKDRDDNESPLRIDLSCSSRPVVIKSCLVALNSVRVGVVLDHFGVTAEL